MRVHWDVCVCVTLIYKFGLCVCSCACDVGTDLILLFENISLCDVGICVCVLCYVRV